MNGELKRLILERLDKDEALDTGASLLVLAACEGEDALTAALEGETSAEAATLPATQKVEEQAGAYLDSITVEGFRGIGKLAVLRLTPGPGLTLVVGRNGSGKSSFAEALEVLLTGDNKRWADRVVVWKEGWRNLHQSDKVFIEAGVIAEGRGGRTSVRRSWDATAGLDDGETEVHRPGEGLTTLDDFGWSEALANYRPFLSYNELGSLLDEGPSKLYDALSAILGLDALVETESVIAAPRKLREKTLKGVKAALKPLLAELSQLDDERATKCHKALSGRKWEIETAEAVVLDLDDEVDVTAQLAALRGLATIEPPVAVDVAEQVVAALRAADSAMQEVATTAAATAFETAKLLEDSLAHHDHQGGNECPVCGTNDVLDSAWRTAASKRVKDLRARAESVEQSHATAKTARSGATRLLRSPPAKLSGAAAVEIDADELSHLWAEWAQGPNGDTLESLAAHIEGRAFALCAAIDVVRKEARGAIEDKQELWTPLARKVERWVVSARTAQQLMSKVPALKAAEAWLKETSSDLRNERFAPIADEAARIWEQLRMSSNVELAQIRLAGGGTRRRVTLDVRIDGVAGSALGVMSQGELHSLALSLFFPRATLPESPFRFVTIDDPVQSMDPSRVGGLARVLSDVAKTRQVIVFTHDDRLPVAVRDLGISATIVEVSRRPGSIVELRQSLDPVSRHLEDAYALANTDNLPPEVAARTVPGYCRSAIEAACIEVVRRRRLGTGESNQALEAALKGAKTLTKLAALALFDDSSRGGDVYARLNHWGTWAGDTFRACNAGTHVGHGGALVDLINSAKGLAGKFQGLT